MNSPTDEAAGPLTCFDCDGPVRAEWRDYTFTYGVDDSAVELTARIPVDVCMECGAGSLGHDAQVLKHEAVCAHHGVLTPREVRAIRKRHDLSRAAFAEISGLGEATLHRWENGILIQNRANDRYLRLLESAENLRRLRRAVARSGAAAPNRRPTFRVVEDVPALQAEQGEFELRRAA